MERKKIKPMEGCPTGYRFHPSENDLLFHYLSKKVEGDSDAIPPFKPEIFDADSQESFCVFTRLKIIKSRVKRTAGSGIWSNGNKRTIVDSRGDTVGYNKLFTFKSLTGREKTKNGRWTMHDHSMKGQDTIIIASQMINVCYPAMHYKITFEENTREVNTPPSSSTQGGGVGGASTPVQPWTNEPELAPCDLYDELGKLLRY
ncbi:hypothetical protein ACJRO7_008972 [Eucalyptus globulus]|uniref:NAC domain-containing protein n=1 Tax=Eucalyptus globulus TaxID=34317 RepID=A0ABD3ISG2_EUCGL